MKQGVSPMPEAAAAGCRLCIHRRATEDAPKTTPQVEID